MSEHVLDNGLKVILKEMHHAPIASFFVWYKVGGRNEVPGITGISHWVEHMMFKGTSKYGKGELDRVFSKHGALWNAFTWLDYTAYFEVMPVGVIDLSLDIESDRMVNCLFDPGEVESERTVIISEREGAENDPRFWLDEAVSRAAFSVHPYGQGVIGAISDLKAMTRDDLFNHYKKYYVPDNAVVVAAGDFNTGQMFEKIKTSFGHIPKGDGIRKIRSVEPVQEGERRVYIRRPGAATYGIMAYHIPRADHPRFYPLMVLDAVLSGGKALAGWGRSRGMGKSSRLYKAIVEKELATVATSSIDSCIDPGLMKISLTLRQGVDPGKAEDEVYRVIDDIVKNGFVKGELETVKKQIIAQVAYSSEGVENNALALGMFEMVSSWKHAFHIEEKIKKIHEEDVIGVCNDMLSDRNRTVGWFLPDSNQESSGVSGGNRAKPFYFRSRETKPVSMPGSQDIVRKKLSNGTILLCYRNSSIDFAHVSVMVDAGSYASPLEQAGLANITNLCLTRGTEKHSSEDINKFTDGHGMILNSRTGRDTAMVSITALTSDMGKALELLGEVVMEPSFNQKEVKRLKEEILTSIRESNKDTARLAQMMFWETVYPQGHPYAFPILGKKEAVKAFESSSLKTLHQRCYVPEKTIVAMVSDAPEEHMISAMENVFGKWHNTIADTDCHDGRDVEVPYPTGKVENFRFIPGKTQCDIALGFPCINRTHPDFYKVFVANMILGRIGLGGRIGRNVRDKQGLAYYAYATVTETKGQGVFVVRAGVNPGGVEKAVDSILAEIEGFRSVVCQEEELNRVKGYIKGYLPISAETATGLCAKMLHMEYFRLGMDYLKDFLGIIDEISREDVLEMAGKYFMSNDYVLIVTGPDYKDGSR